MSSNDRGGCSCTLAIVLLFVTAPAAPFAAGLSPLPLEAAAANDTPFRQSLSPDGRWLAEDRLIASGYLRAHVQDLKMGETILLGDRGESSWAPVWSPDGRKLAYFQSEGGNATLWIRDMHGDLRQVSDVSALPLGPYSAGEAVQWLPDSERLIALLTPKDQYTPREGFSLRHTPFAQADPDELAVTVYGGDEAGSTPPLPPQPCGALWGYCDLGLIDLRVGSVRRLKLGVPAGAVTTTPTFQISTDGKFVVFYERAKEDPIARSRPYLQSLYELTLCEVATMVCAEPRAVALDDFSTWRSKLSALFPEIHWPNVPRENRILGPKKRDPRQGYALGSSGVLHWKNTDGSDGAGALLLPPGYKQGKRLPLVVWVYGNDKGSAKADLWDWGWHGGVFDFQVLATRGYAVLYPDTPVNIGSVRQDIDRAVNAGVDAAIEQGYADPQRLAIMGQSGGSHSVLSVITSTPRFKAAIVTGSVGHPDLVAAYLQGGPAAAPDRIGAYLEDSNPRMNGSPWRYKDRYIANSPIYDFDKIQTPLLMGKGENDSDDGFAGDAIFLALRRLQKPVEYRIYRGEGHAITRPANVIDFWSRRLVFLARHLDIFTDASGSVVFENQRVKPRAQFP